MDLELVQTDDPKVHDLVIRNGDLQLIAGPESIRQDLDVRLRMYQGELRAAPSSGTPWYQSILPYGDRDKGYDPDEIELELTNVILSTPGVVEIDRELEIDDSRLSSERIISISFSATITDGSSLVFDLELIV